MCFSTSCHPLTLLLHNYQTTARHCISAARDKLIVGESSTKHQAPAERSAWNMSDLHRSLPSGENPANSDHAFTETGAPSVGVNLDSGSAAENLSILSGNDGGKQVAESLASDLDSFPSSLSSSVVSSDPDQDTSSSQSFNLESHITRDMAAEILVLVDQLENSVLTAFDELQSPSVSEDVHNVLQLTLQGCFFTHLWDDVLSIYR